MRVYEFHPEKRFLSLISYSCRYRSLGCIRKLAGMKDEYTKKRNIRKTNMLISSEKRMKNVLLSFILLVFSASIHAEIPLEIQGDWVPDVEKSIALMKENMSDLDEAGVTFMRDRMLPSKKITISENQFIHASGDRVLKAEISLKEKRGESYVMLLTSDSTPDLIIEFIPKDNGRYIIASQNPSDGSGNIIWQKQ